jgi:hypothetical protein
MRDFETEAWIETHKEIVTRNQRELAKSGLSKLFDIASLPCYSIQ